MIPSSGQILQFWLKLMAMTTTRKFSRFWTSRWWMTMLFLAHTSKESYKQQLNGGSNFNKFLISEMNLKRAALLTLCISSLILTSDYMQFLLGQFVSLKVYECRFWPWSCQSWGCSKRPRSCHKAWRPRRMSSLMSAWLGLPTDLQRSHLFAVYFVCTKTTVGIQNLYTSACIHVITMWYYMDPSLVLRQQDEISAHFTEVRKWYLWPMIDRSDFNGWLSPKMYCVHIPKTIPSTAPILPSLA